MRKPKVRRAADLVRKRLEAEQNNVQIDTIFRKVTRRVLDETSDHVLVALALFIDVGGFGKRCLGDEGNGRTFEALFASHVTYGVDNSADYLLAEVVRSENGFPCVICCDGYEFHCGDAKGLERALARMLELESTAVAFAEIRDDTQRGSNPDRCRRHF